MIRAVRAGDAEAVAALVRRAFGAIPVPLHPAPSALRLTGADVLAQLTGDGGGGAVWDESGVRGCVLWQERPAELYLGRLAVEPGWQGRGIARALLGAGEAEARRLGADRITLAVRLALTGNRRLFAAIGFRETALHTHPGFTEPTFVDAEKRLR